jgi:hypothetical protein
VSGDTVIAAGATVTAVVALAVSILESRAVRDHNRRSVRPILQVRSAGFRTGQVAGVKVVNVGLGPARVVAARVWLDGVEFGATDKAGLDRLRETVGGVRPSAVSFTDGSFLATNYDEYLLSIPEYDPKAHADFATLIRERLRVRITYESLYGERFETPDAPTI